MKAYISISFLPTYGTFPRRRSHIHVVMYSCVYVVLHDIWCTYLFLVIIISPTLINSFLAIRYCEPAGNWAQNLTLPTRFSKVTTEAIKSGVLTKKARVEIHNSLATVMLVYTSRPTTIDREIICRRLIEKYPCLRDGSPSGYVSSATKLCSLTYDLFLLFFRNRDHGRKCFEQSSRT